MQFRDPKEAKAEVVKLQGMLLADGVRRAAVSLAEQVGTTPPGVSRANPGRRPNFELLVQNRLSRLDGRYRALLEGLPDAVVIVDGGGDIVVANLVAEQLFGAGHDELSGQAISRLVPDGLADRLPGLLSEAGPGAALDLVGRRRDGSAFPAEVLLNRVAFEGDTLVAISIRDVSQRKAAERRLLRREGRFRGLLEAAPDAMLAVNRRGKILLVNRHAETWLGYSRDELQTQHLSLVAPAILVDRVTGHGQPGGIDRLVGEREPFEAVLRCKDGTSRDADVTMSLYQAEEGALVTISIRDQSGRHVATRRLEAEARHLRALLHATPDPMLVLDSHGDIVDANAEALAKLGHSRGELVGRSVAEVVPEGLLERLVNDPLIAAEDQLARQIGVGLELHARTSGGDVFPVEVMLARCEAEGAARTIVAMRDISVRRQMEAELIAGVSLESDAGEADAAAGASRRRLAEERRSIEEALFTEQERAEVTLNAIADAVCCTDRHGRVTFLNRMAEQMTGWSAAQGRGRPIDDILTIVDAATRVPLPNRPAGGEGGGQPLRRDGLIVRRDGFEMPIEESIATIRDRSGRPDGSVIVVRDVRAARASALEMAHSARHDFLTGLPNRMLFNDRVNQAIAQAPRRGRKVALLFIDLDGFKHINDTLGHSVGDKLLQSMARRLVACVRAADTVSRIGGDEFVILLSEVERADDVAQLAGRILRAVADVHDVDGHDIRLGASIGISVHPDDGTDAETMVHNADMAMYQAKESGRHCYRFFTQQMNERAAERQAVETRLRRALERQEFVLHYQPKVNLRTGEIVGAEALLRWAPEVANPVPAAEFVAVAESTGLIRPIGLWCLREACRQARQWLDAGIALPMVAVNISACEFRGDHFLEGVFSALDETRLPPGHLELELTEGALMRNVDHTANLLDALRDKGVRLVVDDFGTGYSSLSNLRRFPIDTLKIDQTFVRMIGSSEEDAAVVAAALNMARSLKLRCMAEGVETAEELAFLQANNCELAQGYYFSRPLPARQFTHLLRTGLLDSMATRRQGA